MSYGNYYAGYTGGYGAPSYGPPSDPRINTIQSYINSFRLYKSPAYVRDHSSDLFRFFPGLQPTYQLVQERGGNLILLKGTIPILYQSMTYNIPIKIFLPYGYPMEQPIVQLDPTPDMFIVNNHHLVDTYGICNIGTWTASSTLSPIIKHFCDVFSTYPPLQSRGSQQQQQQQPPPQSPHRNLPTTPTPIPNNVNSGGSSGSGSNSGVQTPPLPSNGSPPPYTGGSWGQPPPSYDSFSKSKQQLNNSPPTTTTNNNVLQPPSPQPQPTTKPLPQQPTPPLPTPANNNNSERDELIKKCTIKLQQMLSKTYESSCSEVRDFNANNKSLEERISKLQNELKNTEKDIEYSEKTIQSISNESEKVQIQIKEFEKNDPSQVNVEVVLGPSDPLSKQILRLTAEISAIEDTYQYVDKSLREDRITLDEYIKIIRTLSRDQFTAKATLKKAQEVFTKSRFQAQQIILGITSSTSSSTSSSNGHSNGPLSPPTSLNHNHQQPQLSQLY